MAMTEDQKIEFIISKMDIYLEECEEHDIKEALDIIVSNYMTEDERKTFVAYFYRLFKGYNKYKHINLLIDYHKNIEKLTNDTSDLTCDTSKCPKTIRKKLADELTNEILDVDVINNQEMIKLKSFFIKIFISLFAVAMTTYLFFMAFFLKDTSEIIIGISKMFQ